jgi:hypothetical protein
MEQGEQRPPEVVGEHRQTQDGVRDAGLLGGVLELVELAAEHGGHDASGADGQHQRVGHSNSLGRGNAVASERGTILHETWTCLAHRARQQHYRSTNRPPAPASATTATAATATSVASAPPNTHEQHPSTSGGTRSRAAAANLRARRDEVHSASASERRLQALHVVEVASDHRDAEGLERRRRRGINVSRRHDHVGGADGTRERGHRGVPRVARRTADDNLP